MHRSQSLKYAMKGIEKQQKIMHAFKQAIATDKPAIIGCSFESVTQPGLKQLIYK